MKKLLSLLLLLWTYESWSQSILRNSYTTNATGRTPNVLPTSTNTIYPMMVLNPDGSGTDRQILFSEYLTLTGTNTTLGGNLSLNGRTNKLSIANNTLFLDGVQVSGGSESAPVNNFYSTNNFFVSGKGNTLIVTQALTIEAVKTNVLATTSSGLVTNANYGSGITWDPSTLTISASGGGGASTWVPVTALAYSGGTNITMSAAGSTNFTVTLTNTTFMAAPTEAPSSPTTNTSWTVTFKQDATGGRLVTWTNKFFFPGGSLGAFQPDTNANAVSMVTITTSPYTNGNYFVDYGILGLAQ